MSNNKNKKERNNTCTLLQYLSVSKTFVNQQLKNGTDSQISLYMLQMFEKVSNKYGTNVHIHVSNSTQYVCVKYQFYWYDQNINTTCKLTIGNKVRIFLQT